MRSPGDSRTLLFSCLVGWDLGAYHEVNSSDFVAVPAQLIVDVCGFDPLD
jgi:hypothetical protein